MDDIRNVLLSVPGTRERVPLSEIAEVADTHQEQRLWARLDGVPAVKLSVRKQPDANTVKVAEGVGRRIEQLAGSRFVPDDIHYEIVADQSFFIRNALAGVRDAALLGAALAMLIVLLFLGSLRKTFIIGLSIPLAVLATFAMMGMGHLTLNIMSLGGLALGIGMLVDNSIVMLENIFRHHRMGVTDPVEAAHRGSGEVSSAVVASTLTNLAAVVPFLLISGLAALIFRELILTISFAIVASLGVALTLVPMLSAQLAKVERTSRIDRSRLVTGFDRGLQRLHARVPPGRGAGGALPLVGGGRGVRVPDRRSLPRAGARQRVPPLGGRRQRQRVSCGCLPARLRSARTTWPSRSRRSWPRCRTCSMSSPPRAASSSADPPWPEADADR